MPTIKQLADELGMSKQGIRKYIAQLPADSVISKDDRGVVQLSSESAEIIKQMVSNRQNRVTGNQVVTNKPVTTELPVTRLENDSVTGNQVVTDALVTGNSVVTENRVTGNQTRIVTEQKGELDTLISMLQKELDGKNAIIESQSRQLEHANQSIQELTIALKSAQVSAQQAQALHAGTLHKQLKEGEQETVTTEEYKEETAPVVPEDVVTATKKRGFFSRLIRK